MIIHWDSLNSDLFSSAPVPLVWRRYLCLKRLHFNLSNSSPYIDKHMFSTQTCPIRVQESRVLENAWAVAIPKKAKIDHALVKIFPWIGTPLWSHIKFTHKAVKLSKKHSLWIWKQIKLVTKTLENWSEQKGRNTVITSIKLQY